MTTHHLRLHDEPFCSIADGSKSIEARLYDDKRRLIKVGDELVFTNRLDGRTLSVHVTELLLYPTFQELFASRPSNEFGGESVERLNETISQFYTPDEQAKYGVIGIKFKLVDII